MENVKIAEFLSSGYGTGYGTGDGSGYGYRSGDGYGYGYGSGDGYDDGTGDGYDDGSGDGYGYGYGVGVGSGFGFGDGGCSGEGSGIAKFCGNKVHTIDDTLTILRHIHGDIAKGFILRGDLTLEPCYVVKQDGIFAHGKTIHAARDALLEKLFDDMPEEDRIDRFIEAHAAGVPYPNRDFFDWHHRLTGSCEQGRMAFAKEHGIDLENGSMTVAEFIALTERSYGGSVIRKLREHYPDA